MLTKKTHYGLRAHVELAIQRYKRIFGYTMKARELPRQKTEAWFSASALNTMTSLGMPMSVKIEKRGEKWGALARFRFKQRP